MKAGHYGEIKKRMHAALDIFSGSTAPIGKLRSVGSMLSGVNPAIDRMLVEYDENLATLEKALQGDVVTLAAEQLPEGTEEEKKRKKAALFFLKFKKELAEEVARVEREMESSENGASSQNLSMWAKIFAVTKGPLALATVIAVGVGVLQTVGVSITVHNDGCGTIDARTAIPISIPGLKLPNGPIPTGGTATAVMPPLPVEVDGTVPGALTFSAATFNMSLQLGKSMRDVTWNGVSLVGVKSSVKLSERKEHELRIICGS